MTLEARFYWVKIFAQQLIFESSATSLSISVNSHRLTQWQQFDRHTHISIETAVFAETLFHADHGERKRFESSTWILSVSNLMLGGFPSLSTSSHPLCWSWESDTSPQSLPSWTFPAEPLQTREPPDNRTWCDAYISVLMRTSTGSKMLPLHTTIWSEIKLNFIFNVPSEITQSFKSKM